MMFEQKFHNLFDLPGKNCIKFITALHQTSTLNLELCHMGVQGASMKYTLWLASAYTFQSESSERTLRV